MSEDISQVELVLQRVRATAAPPLGSATRVLHGVARQIGGNAPVQHDAGAARQPDPAGPPPAAAAPRAWGLHLARLGRWVVFGLAAGGFGYWWGYQRAARVPVEQSAAAPVAQPLVAPSVALSLPQPSAPAQPDSAPSPTSASEPARAGSVPRGTSEPPAQTNPRYQVSPRRRLAQARSRAGASSSQGLDLHEVLQLLSRAQSALRRGLPDRALELLDELERREPKELLLEERRVTRILSLCELGQVDQARVLRQELGPGPVSSIYAGRLDASCAGVEHTTTDLKSSTPRPDPGAADTTSP